MSIKIKRFLAGIYPEHAPFFLRQPTIQIIKRRPITLPEAVVRVVIGQMLSSSAAGTIYARVCVARDLNKLKGSWLLDYDTLKGCGLSGSKAKTIISFGEKVGDDPSALDYWYELTPEDLYAAICANKGMGEWTAGIIALFYVGHQDVFPSGDGSLVRAVSALERKAFKSNSVNIFNPDLARPYRSYLALYLWQGLDGGLLK